MGKALAIGGPGLARALAGAAHRPQAAWAGPKILKNGRLFNNGQGADHRRSGPGLGLLLAIGNRQSGPDWAKLGDFRAWLGQIGAFCGRAGQN